MNNLCCFIDEYKNEKTKKFNEKLSPDTNYSILGVTIPNIRKIANEIIKEAKNDDEIIKYIEQESNIFEEVILQGILIAYSKFDIYNRIKLLQKYVNKIDGWAICDTVVNSLKIKDKEKNIFFDYIMQYRYSEKEFEIRFLLVCLLSYYINDEYVDDVIKICDEVKAEGYYAKMAKAWALSFVGIKYNDLLMKYLNSSNNLDKFTYNKTLQKMIESKKIDESQKKIFKEMKMK